MNFKNLWIITLILVCFSCKKEDEPDSNNEKGYNMLLIGNSFFKPYAQKIDTLALDAGFNNHNSTLITRGGENGRPINFWNDSTTQAHNDIKSALDEGNIEIFGMTSGHDTSNPNDRVEGHRAWIEYALQNNPDITIFIAIPQIDFPQKWDSMIQVFSFNTMQDFYGFVVNDIVHNEMINQLRLEFPSTNIFSIPTGWAGVELNQMYKDGALLDNIGFMGPKHNSLFTDEKGHQGQIIIETGSLIWLNSIYNVDLSTNNHETGFNTDLHAIAKQVMDNHDTNYKQ